MLRYCSAAWVYAALAARSRCRSVPPSEDWLRYTGTQIPKARASREHLGEDQSHAAGVGGQRETREPVGDRNSDQGASGVQILFGLANIWTLLDEL